MAIAKRTDVETTAFMMISRKCRSCKFRPEAFAAQQRSDSSARPVPDRVYAHHSYVNAGKTRKRL
jgi:hypothetical protein